MSAHQRILQPVKFQICHQRCWADMLYLNMAIWKQIDQVMQNSWCLYFVPAFEGPCLTDKRLVQSGPEKMNSTVN